MSSNIQIGINSQKNTISGYPPEKGNKLALKAGDIFKATVVSITDGKAKLESKKGFSFEAGAADLNARVGDELTFEIVKSDKSGVTLKQLRARSEKSQSNTKQASTEELLNMFKQNNLITDADQDSDEQKKAMEAIARIKRQLAYTGGNITSSAIRELVAGGLSLEKISLDILNTVMMEIERKPIKDVSDEELEMLAWQAARDKLTKNKELIRHLTSQELPVNETNMKSLESVAYKSAKLSPLDDETLAYLIKSGKELTVDNIYIAKYSSKKNPENKAVTAELLKELRTQIEKVLEHEGIDKTDENLQTAEFLIENDIPVTGAHISKAQFLKNLKGNLDTDSVMAAACENIRKGKAPASVNLYSLEGESARRDSISVLKGNYDSLLTGLNTIDHGKINILISRRLPVTLNNLRNEAFSVDQPPEADSLQSITAKRQLAEIQLKLTKEAAYRLADKGIDINPMPLEEAVEQLRTVEKEVYAKHLRIMGAEDNAENTDIMTELYGKIREFSFPPAKAFGSLLLNKADMTVNRVHRSIVAAKAALEYEANATVIMRKYGDSFSTVAGQIEPVLENLSLDTDKDNTAAAAILIKNGIDITKENLTAVKILNAKIHAIYERLHPNITANMIKDGFNPADMHLDEVLSYIDAFNDIYGRSTDDKIAESILEMDNDKSLDSVTRNAMTAIYRMLNLIQKDNSAALGVTLKNGTNVTLGNLLEDAKFFHKTKGRHGVINTAVDDLTGGGFSRNVPENNIKRLLNTAFEHAMSQLTEDERAQAKMLLSEALMGNVADNVAKAADIIAAQAEDPVNSLLNYEWTLFGLNSVAENASYKAMLGFVQDNPNYADMKIEELLDLFDDFETRAADTGHGYDEVIAQIRNTSAQAVLWLERNNLEPTFNNIVALSGLLKNGSFITDSLKQLPDDDYEDISKDIPEEFNEEFAQALPALSERLKEAKENKTELSVIKQFSLIQNAVKVQNFVQKRENNNYYQVPIKLHDKIGSLNIYIVNNRNTNSENRKIYMSINTTNLGNVSVYMDTDGKTAKLVVNTENEDASIKLKAKNAELMNMIEGLGINVAEVKYGIEESKNILEREIRLPPGNVSHERSGLSEYEFTV